MAGYTLGYRIVAKWISVTTQVDGDLLVNATAEAVLASSAADAPAT